jgi:hypothetical protein
MFLGNCSAAITLTSKNYLGTAKCSRLWFHNTKICYYIAAPVPNIAGMTCL